MLHPLSVAAHVPLGYVVQDLCIYSLGLTRVSKQYSQLVLIQNCVRYTVDFPPVYDTFNENQLSRAQQNQKEDTDIYRLLSRNTSFWRKYVALIQNCQSKVFRGVSASLWYIERNQLLHFAFEVV